LSFFVSDALKGRITEENLLDEKEKNKKLEREIVYVSAKFENFSHDFKFVSFKKEKSVETLTIEVHESYRYLSTLLKPDSKFIVNAPDGIISCMTLKKNSYEIIRQNERSCYLLKIFIDA
jgi:hypothetical protein